METEAVYHVETKLRAAFGEAILSSGQAYDFPVYIIERASIKEVLRFLKEELGFGFLTTLCGLHFPDQPGAELAMMYQLHKLETNERIRLKTFMPISDPRMPTITDLWAGANWMEREAYDFFGFEFSGHPDLRRILNMDEMNYFPMRKEFPLEDATRDDKEDLFFGR